ncbi:PLP-dependent transferase [Faecalibaculum rodentium]|nr:PLP-dependent transferase [Faecalibaculum rodentium]
MHDATIRLSIGTEHIDDILEDLERGFAAAFPENG